MSSISAEEVKKLAALSALSITDDQIPALQADLNQIVEYIDQLQLVDTSNVEPTYAVHGLENVMREDVVIERNMSRDDLLKNAPTHNNESIVVPRVIE